MVELQFGIYVDGELTATVRTREQGESWGRTMYGVSGYEVKPIPDVDKPQSLSGIVDHYYQFRSLTKPDAGQALLFLVSEVGELADAHVHHQAEWVRNNQRDRNVPDEIGDVMMMLTVYAAANGTDPVGCMLDKMRRKGLLI